jgi:SHS2 domain-containing protein
VEEAAGGALRLAATARGETYDPERHPIKVLIKGITYHGLEVVEGADGRWRARVIFDI